MRSKTALLNIFYEKEYRSLGKILTTNLLSAVLCLGFVTYGRYKMVDSEFILYIFICGLFGLSNYLFFGMQEYIYRGKRYGKNIIPVKYIKYFVMISLFSWTMIALLPKIIVFNEVIVKALEFHVVLFPLQAASILLRSVFEFNIQREFPAIIKAINVTAIYSRPIFEDQASWSILVLSIFFASSLILGGKALKNFTIIKGNSETTLKDIFLTGFNVNAVWAYSQVIPLIEKAFFLKLFSSSTSATLIFLSEIFQRAAIIYGMVGNFYFPRLAENTKKIGEFRRIVVLQFKVYVALVFVAGISTILLATFFPFARSYLDLRDIQIDYILVFGSQFLLLGFLSLLVRPLYLLNRIYLLTIWLSASAITYYLTIYFLMPSIEILFLLLLIHSLIDLLVATFIFSRRGII